MRTEVATAKPKRKLCSDTTTLVQTMQPGLHHKSIGAKHRNCRDRVRTNTAVLAIMRLADQAWVGSTSKGPQRLGARGSRDLRAPELCLPETDAGYTPYPPRTPPFVSGCKGGKKRVFTLSVLKPSNAPPKVNGLGTWTLRVIASDATIVTVIISIVVTNSNKLLPIF